MLALVLTSCIFSPHKDDSGGGPPPPVVYEKLIDPYSVLAALKTAYHEKDSVEIKLIYDINYAGTSFDPDPNGSGQISLTRQDEIRHVQALYREPSITSVSMTLPGSLNRYEDLSDPPGWATIDVQGMLVEINATPTSYNLIPGGVWQFKFIPTSPDSTSPTDTTWKIVRWTEFSN